MRKKNFFLVLIFIGFLNTSFNKVENKVMQKNFIYIVNLYPSFHPNCEIQIYFTSKKKSIELNINDRRKIDSDFHKTENITEKDIEKLMFNLKDTELINFKPKENSYGMDGMSVDNIFYQDEQINKFSFWSPENNSEESKILTSVIELAKSKFNNEKCNEYFENVKKYYPQ